VIRKRKQSARRRVPVMDGRARPLHKASVELPGGVQRRRRPECRAAQGRRQQPQHAVGQFVFDVVRSGGQQPPMRQISASIDVEG